MRRAARGPAGRNHGQQLMLTGWDLMQFMDRILQVSIVIGKAGGEVVIVQALAVEIEIENA